MCYLCLSGRHLSTVQLVLYYVIRVKAGMSFVHQSYEGFCISTGVALSKNEQ